jgi:hypothetical protein
METTNFSLPPSFPSLPPSFFLPSLLSSFPYSFPYFLPSPPPSYLPPSNPPFLPFLLTQGLKLARQALYHLSHSATLETTEAYIMEMSMRFIMLSFSEVWFD